MPATRTSTRASLVLVLLLGLVAVGLTAAPAARAAADRGAVDRQAPSLRLQCHGSFRHSKGRPVLLVPGTTLTPAEFAWNYERVFTRQKRAWCAVTLPQHALGDIQVAGELVARAITKVHAKAGRRISVIGHSQGGMVPRWALKYWPKTRTMVDDLIGLAPSNHGTILAPVICAAPCAPAIWQQATGSAFLKALNDGPETYRGISYTQVWSATDEIVVPNVPGIASSPLTTGRGKISNIPIQSVCPLAVADHLTTGTSDPVGYAAVRDALTHRGPAKARRFDTPAVCTQLIFPGIDPVAFPANFARLGTTAAQQLVVGPHVAREPRLARYARR